MVNRFAVYYDTLHTHYATFHFINCSKYTRRKANASTSKWKELSDVQSVNEYIKKLLNQEKPRHSKCCMLCIYKDTKTYENFRKIMS